MKDRREESIQEFNSWLKAYTWAWYCNLKITSGIPSVRRARNILDKWLSDLRREEGGENFRWFWVLERGSSGGNNLHFHALIGGLQNRRKLWEQKWNELGGDALITTFDPERKGILYLLQGMSKDGDLDFDCRLPPEKQNGDGAEESLQEKQIIPATVLVENIDDITTLRELRRLFEPYGTIMEIAILETRVERDRTLLTAAITFGNAFCAANAVMGRNAAKLGKNEIRVSLWGK